LQTIADRFSKIGSTPVLEAHDLGDVLDNSLQYLKKRISKKVTISTDYQVKGNVQLNLSLFEWVIENITKNAVDAMEGRGHIDYTITVNGHQVYLDITDTGKGIPKGKQKTIFEPGFTTKKRGWGLGLTLVKRIIDIYHKGEIFVKKSEQNKGTTFRIILHLAENKKNI
jgi:signal transduction histidine kinase